MKQRDYYKNFYWDELRSSSPSSSTSSSLFHLRKIFLEHLPASGVILDVGCGRGTNGQFIQQRQQAYIGLDLSFLALRQARELNLTTALADLEQPLPFPSEVFAGAICLEVIEHLFDPRSLLEETQRILKPRGVVIVSVPNIAHHSHRLRLLGGKFVAGGHPDTTDTPWCDPHIRFFSRRSLHDLLNTVGFQILKTYGLGTAFLTSIPVLSVWLARTLGKRRAQALSNFFDPLGNLWPSLFAGHLITIAQKPASSSTSVS